MLTPCILAHPRTAPESTPGTLSGKGLVLYLSLVDINSPDSSVEYKMH